MVKCFADVAECDMALGLYVGYEQAMACRHSSEVWLF